MAKLSAEQIADKQIKRTKAAVQEYKDGVRRTKKDPAERAIAQKQKMIDNFNAALADGSWEDGLRSYTFDEWKEQTAEKGGANIGTGIEKARPKIVAFQQQFGPVRDSVQAQVDAMPSATFEDRMARMVANAEGLHQFKFKKRRKS